MLIKIYMNQEQNKTDRFAVGVVAVCALIIGIFVGLVGRDTVSLVNKSFNITTNAPNIPGDVIPQSNSEDLYDKEYVSKVINIFKQRYIEEIDADNSADYTYGVIKGFISALDDRYTTFLTPEEAAVYYSQRNPDFEGIGVTLGYNEEGGYTYVESVLKAHPAERNGILPLDIIYKVDGEDMSGKRPEEVAPKIRGEKGSIVSLQILRDSEGSFQEQNFSITRETIQIDNIQWEPIDDSTVKINIIQFSDNTVNEFNANWTSVVNDITSKTPNLKNIIVDLRNNPGGYVMGVQYVMEEFLPNGAVIMRERSKKDGETQYTDKRTGSFEDKKVVILVNQGSASASEIFTSGLQENGRAQVVGMPTVGKGVEQELIELSDGSLLMLVFQQWLTPNGNEISEDNPIKPEFEVEITQEDYQSRKDPQLDKALELLR